MSDTINLEGYSLPLRKQKIFCISESTQSLDIMFQGLYKQYSEEVIRRNKVICFFSDIYMNHHPKNFQQQLIYSLCFRYLNLS